MSSPAKLPHYLAIKNELEKRILSGQLGAGQKFPSEEELSKEFSVSSSTVKRAIGVPSPTVWWNERLDGNLCQH